MSISFLSSLESRPRQEEFERVLRAEIHDPLWMLTRQWQFGEYQGEDTGSPIMAHYEVESAPITHLQTGDNQFITLDNEEAIEPIVEQQSKPFDYKDRVQAAKRWQQLLKKHSANLLEGNKWFDHLALYQKLFPFNLPKIDSDQPHELVEKAKMLTNESLHQYLSFIALRSFDGIKLFQYLVANGTKISGELKTGLDNIDPSAVSSIGEVAEDFVQWFRQRFGDPTVQVPDSWKPSQLEYQFACVVPGADEPTVLSADEYYQGSVKWHTFDIASSQGVYKELAEQAKTTSARSKIERKTRTVIPVEVSFAGMPKARWWEMEDGGVNFTKINANTTDIGKIIVTQFALQYSNDWYMIPIPLNNGALHRISGIVVKDTFGQRTLIQAANKHSSTGKFDWNFFQQDAISGDDQTGIVDEHLFLPPALPEIKKSSPIEKVYFIRDEMANLVWGIEDAIPNGIGQSMDGHAAATELDNYLKALASNSEKDQPALNTVLKYTLFKNTTTENWIPFIPTRIGDRNRDIRLQRAAIPRFFDGKFLHIRPRTTLLQYGLSTIEHPKLPLVRINDELPNKAYYINEEEILKTGIMVQGRNQRSRWYNGKELNWYGYKKSIGRTKQSSVLGFDILEPIAPKE